MRDDFLWVEKYRPRTVKDLILPDSLKNTFQAFVDQKNVPNLLLSGRAGVGKTTIARAMLEELKCDYIVINGSMDNGIATLRDNIQRYASASSIMEEGRKYVILDEADYLTAAMQPALRNFMEQFANNCGFILTCNYKQRIIPELHSRCTVIDFAMPAETRADLAKAFYKRVTEILTSEAVEYDPKAVIAVIARYFPDWRRVLNELQGYAATGKIDAGILSKFNEESVAKLVGMMKAKDFSSIRKWVVDNASRESSEVYKTLYDTSVDYLKPESIPFLVLIIAKYQYQASFAVDQQINLTAALVEIMAECSFK